MTICPPPYRETTIETEMTHEEELARFGFGGAHRMLDAKRGVMVPRPMAHEDLMRVALRSVLRMSDPPRVAEVKMARAVAFLRGGHRAS